MSATIECAKHGAQGRAYVCQHTINSMYDGVARGLYWTNDETGAVNAYCQACEDYRLQNGGEWPSNSGEFIKPVVLCLECFERAKRINGW